MVRRGRDRLEWGDAGPVSRRANLSRAMRDPTTLPRPRRFGRVGAVALVMVLAACSGDDATPPSTTVAVTASPVVTAPATSAESTPPPTTVAVTAASTAPTTAPATTTTATTATPPPTSATSEPIVVVETDPDSPEVQQMLADFEVHFAAFTALPRDPTDPDVVAAVEATVTGGMASRVEQIIALLDERNQIAIPNPDVPTRVVVTDESITLSDDGAGFDACLIDGETLVDRDDPDPMVTDPTSRSVTYGLTKVDGRWLVATLQFFTEFPGQVGCG